MSEKLDVEIICKDKPKSTRVDIYGYDEYGRFQFETLWVADKPVTTKLAYATLGSNLPEDFIVKIGAWFWK